MSEVPNIKILAVCGNKTCLEHNSKNVVIEFDFNDKCIYYICPKCKERSEMGQKQIQSNPYPKARLTH
jgi:aspartate carbamoyltransferase regulatory subunit